MLWNARAPLLAYLRELQRRHAIAVIVVHHAKKGAGHVRAGQALRGSSEFHAWGEPPGHAIGIGVEFDRGVGLDPAGQLAHLPERRPPVEGSQGRCFIPGEAFDRRFGSGPVDALIADLAHPPVNGGVGVLPQGRRRGHSGAWGQSVQ